MTAVAVVGWGRRVLAVAALKLARLTLRAAMALHRRGVVQGPGLRAALVVVQGCERAGAVLALGRRRQRQGGVGLGPHDPDG